MKKFVYITLIGMFFLCDILCFSCTETDLKIVNLRCELIENPLGIDLSAPRLSWELKSKERNVFQISYRILVASTKDKLDANEGDLWDSGDIKSDSSVFISYKGRKLHSRMECYWKVKVTTNKNVSVWSRPAYWTMGLLQPEDWKAHWIGLDWIRLSNGMILQLHVLECLHVISEKHSVHKKILKGRFYIFVVLECINYILMGKL